MGGLDKKKQYTRQKMIIEAIFGVYFYILKLEVSPKLLEPALQGMSKFAHLINVELILDLIAVVSEKLEKEGPKLSLPCKLHCISTTFKVLSGRGTSIEMDVRQHYTTIYEILLSVTLNHYEWEYFGLIFECLNSMFGRHASKSLPVDRVASFVKRLLNISTQLPPYYAVACQHQARKLMITDPRLYNMLDFEGGYNKEYLPFESNPDHANSLSCCLWELSLTSNHYHPFNKVYSRDLSTWSEIPLKLSTSTPDKVMHKYNVKNSGNFRPFVTESKLQKFSMIKHPPKDLDNDESMKAMAEWFHCRQKGKGNRYQQRMKRITQAVLNRGKLADKSIAKFIQCYDLLSQNKVLKELNDEYKLLNKLLQSD